MCVHKVNMWHSIVARFQQLILKTSNKTETMSLHVFVMLEVTLFPSPPLCACYRYSCIYNQLILRLDRVADSQLPLLLQIQ
jgi:hypothetical protein